MSGERPTCMLWPDGRNIGSVCGEPATVRRRVRCLNGCYGEGQFEYTCERHAERVINVKRLACAKCEADVELFPVQEVRVSGPNDQAKWDTRVKYILDNTCLHCGKLPEADGDHSCPCPYPDETCPDHPHNRDVR